VIGDHQSPPPCPSVEIILDGPRGRAILGDNGRGGRPSAVIPDATATGRSFGIDEGGARRRVRKMTGSKEVCGQPAERREREREKKKGKGEGRRSIHFPALPRVAAVLFYETN